MQSVVFLFSLIYLLMLFSSVRYIWKNAFLGTNYKYYL